MTIDLKAIGQDSLRLVLFLAMLLIVRGLPSLLVYRRTLPVRQRAEMMFITATSLPLLIALAEIGQQDGVMLPATSAAFIGTGVLSVLIFPLVAVRLHRGAPLTPTDIGIPFASRAQIGLLTCGFWSSKWSGFTYPRSRLIYGRS